MIRLGELAWFLLAAAGELAGCYAVWAVVRLGRSPDPVGPRRRRALCGRHAGYSARDPLSCAGHRA